MRLLLAAIILTLLSQLAWAEAKKLNTTEFGSFSALTICVDGYKFVVLNRYRGRESAPANDLVIDQFYEEKNGVALPARC